MGCEKKESNDISYDIGYLDIVQRVMLVLRAANRTRSCVDRKKKERREERIRRHRVK